MKKTVLLSIAAAAGLTFSPALSSTEVLAATDEASALTENDLDLDQQKEAIAKEIVFYDENGDVVEPYTLEELKAMIVLDPEKSEVSEVSESVGLTAELAADYRVYSSSAFEFSNSIWIGGGLWGKAFKDPATVFVTPKGTAKDFTISIRKDVDGIRAGDTVSVVDLPGGWSGEIHMAQHHLPRGKSYRYNFLSGGSGTISINNVTVWYD